MQRGGGNLHKQREKERGYLLKVICRDFFLNQGSCGRESNERYIKKFIVVCWLATFNGFVGTKRMRSQFMSLRFVTFYLIS